MPGDELEIIEERSLAMLPRGEREELRLTFTRARTARGETAWHGLRVWYRADDGQMRPGKAGVTIRGKELHAVTVALLRACASAVPQALHGTAKALVEALERVQPPRSMGRPANPNLPRPEELPSDYYARRRGEARP